MKGKSILIIGLLILAIPLVGLAGCEKQKTELRYGGLSGTGVLMRADVSLHRRGSHVLMKNGSKQFYIESRTQNLQEFEGKTVYIEGILVKNTDSSDLPVLEASSVKSVNGDDDMHTWEIPALNIQVETPSVWKPTIQMNVASFFLQDEEEPIMTIQSLSGSKLPQGVSLYVAGRPATRMTGERQKEEVWIRDGTSIIQIHFDPASQKSIVDPEDLERARMQFEEMLLRMTLMTDNRASRPSSGTGASIPCGGSAGILCPQGFFCNISDFQNRIGHCKAL